MRTGTWLDQRRPRTTLLFARVAGAGKRLGASPGPRPSDARLPPVPMPSPRGHIVVVCISVFALVAPALALSDGGSPPPPGTPSIDQYVETVPSSSGGWSIATGSPRSKPLRPGVAKRL